MKKTEFFRLVEEDGKFSVTNAATYLMVCKAMTFSAPIAIPAILLIVLTNGVVNRLIDLKSKQSKSDAELKNQALLAKLDEIESRVSSLVLQQGIKRPGS